MPLKGKKPPGSSYWVLRRRRRAGWAPSGREGGARLGQGTMEDVPFVVIVAQGRSGSTLILRLLNQAPGVRICGENYRAMDHLQRFAGCYLSAADNRNTDFYKIAWMAPCDDQAVMDHLRRLVLDMYGPGKLIGFKEIRYGYEPYEQFAASLDWMRELLPNLRIIFSVRNTRSCMKSEWWARNPIKSYLTLNAMRRKFERYHREHPGGCYWMPYEELRRGSPVLRGLFDFLGLEWQEQYEQPLDRVMR